MADRIKVYDKNLKALGSTSKAFNISKAEELMREYTLSFSVVNADSVFKYLGEGSVFEYHGQKFDIAGIDGDSGETNITQIAAEHISYRLADYTLPNGYSFVGTIREIAEDVLNEAKTVDGIPAITMFSIGTTANLGTVSFGMSNATNVTAREALVAMSELGVEINFDNFTVNLPERIGADNGVIFEYGRNLTGVHRTWQKDNGWNYDVNIVDLQKVPGHESDIFKLGDTVTVIDNLSNITLTERIISYTECDDPTQNRVSIGVFVRDNASLSIETDRIANNSVQQGEKYSNVSINHEDGFIAENRAGTQRVIMNSDDCFAVQVLQNGQWCTVTSADVYGLAAARLTTSDAKDWFFATIGKYNNGKWDYGMQLIETRKDGSNEVKLTIDCGPNSVRIVTEQPDLTIEAKQLNINTDSFWLRNRNGTGLNDFYTGHFSYVKNKLSNGGLEFGTVEVVSGMITDVT